MYSYMLRVSNPIKLYLHYICYSEDCLQTLYENPEPNTCKRNNGKRTFHFNRKEPENKQDNEIKRRTDKYIIDASKYVHWKLKTKSGQVSRGSVIPVEQYRDREIDRGGRERKGAKSENTQEKG